jgi:hypothetical protein
VISVQEVVVDPDMIAPQPYTILRSVGTFVTGGFQSVTTPLQTFGPVQQASNKEIQMLSEADRVGAIRSFWCTFAIYVTRGYAPAPSTHGEVPQGVTPGTVYTLSQAPPNEVGALYRNGLFQTPDVDYTISGATLTLNVGTAPTDKLYFTWPVTANVQAAASDIIQFEGEQYRVLQVYRDPGSGYFKALGTRLAAA